LSRYRWQGIPVYGYTGMIMRMLEGIPVILNFDHLMDPKAFAPRKMTLYTGPIDEYFGFKLGKLRYRRQVRKNRYYPKLKYFQPYHQINYPSKRDGDFIRTIEWKRIMAPSCARKIPKGTIVTREYPEDSKDPNTHEYPFPEKRYRELYDKYKEKADRLSDIMFCGRLGEYKYYDMDQAIENSFNILKRI
jgi:UDP-galactopyranose mutase